MESPDHARLIELLEENLAVAKETQQRLRRMERFNTIWFWVKAGLWILVLIIPLLLIGPYLGALESFLMGGAEAASMGGLPSPDTIKEAIDLYRTGEL